jgi:signal transduction histidine kinase
MLRLEPEEACQECHAPNRLIGVASMHLDMTPQVKSAHDRMGRNMAILIVSWVLAVGALNLIAGRMARRSLDKLEASIGADGGPTTEADGGTGSLFLDPVSEQLYESLRKTLEHQREREAEVSSRIHHTERLASLGQLAAGLAHEIKNPLAGIHGVLELLRDESEESAEGENARRKDLYDEMIGELDRVNDTIHLLLSFARPPSPKRVPVDPKKLLESTVQLMRPGLAKRSIQLEISTPPDLPEIALDPDQIRQVLVNLISNAADAIEKRGAISVKASAFPDGQGLILAVEDDGPGIPEDVLDEIFEPFYTTKFSGTGLGLSVVRSQVQQHGGRIEIESTPGEGTTFFVLLPRPGLSDEETTEGEA